MNPHSRIRGIARRAAFTITEMLAVIAIVVVLIVIAVPSFQAMIKSSEEAMAESTLAAALKAGRDAAFRAGSGNDAAIVFLFEPGGRCTAVPCVRAGTLRDEVAGSTETVEREVFIPAPEFSPIAMPKHWLVRGWVGPNTLTAAGEYYRGGAGSYRYQTGAVGNWVFPETGFFNRESTSAGLSRSTFMVRFAGGSGALVSAPPTAVLVLAPRGTRVTTSGSPSPEETAADPNNPQWAGDPDALVSAVLRGRVKDETSGTVFTLDIDDKRAILGRLSSNIVMARPVAALALYNEQQLGAALGVRLDRGTDSIYLPWSTGQQEPTFVDVSIDPQRINRWMEGNTTNTNAQNGLDAGDVPLAKLFSIDRYTGALRRLEVQP
jgi:type II secretory pathway pseudopilin PulG